MKLSVCTKNPSFKRNKSKKESMFFNYCFLDIRLNFSLDLYFIGVKLN